MYPPPSHPNSPSFHSLPLTHPLSTLVSPTALCKLDNANTSIYCRYIYFYMAKRRAFTVKQKRKKKKMNKNKQSGGKEKRASDASLSSALIFMTSCVQLRLLSVVGGYTSVLCKCFGGRPSTIASINEAVPYRLFYVYVYIYIQISTATMMPTTTIKWLRCSCRRDRDFVLSQLHYFHINPRRRYICVAPCATNLNESNKSAERDASLNHTMPAFPLLIATIFFHFQTRHPARHCYR